MEKVYHKYAPDIIKKIRLKALIESMKDIKLIIIITFYETFGFFANESLGFFTNNCYNGAMIEEKNNIEKQIDDILEGKTDLKGEEKQLKLKELFQRLKRQSKEEISKAPKDDVIST
jgi:hypothetical protein